MKKQIWLLMLSAFFISSCSMIEESINDPGQEDIFSSLDGMTAYTNSFYDILPAASGDQGEIEQDLVDYGAGTALNDFIQRGAFNQDNSSGWDWDDLRNANYFIDQIKEV